MGIYLLKKNKNGICCARACGSAKLAIDETCGTRERERDTKGFYIVRQIHLRPQQDIKDSYLDSLRV